MSLCRSHCDHWRSHYFHTESDWYVFLVSPIACQTLVIHSNTHFVTIPVSPKTSSPTRSPTIGGTPSVEIILPSVVNPGNDLIFEAQFWLSYHIFQPVSILALQGHGRVSGLGQMPSLRWYGASLRLTPTIQQQVAGPKIASLH